MGLLKPPPAPENRPCKTGRILLGHEQTPDGDALDDDDVAMLEALRRNFKAVNGARFGASSMRMMFTEAGISVSQQNVQAHLNGSCHCPDGTPLKGS